MGIHCKDIIRVLLCLLGIVCVIGYKSYHNYRNINYTKSSHNKSLTYSSHDTGGKQPLPERNSYSVYSTSTRSCRQQERLGHVKEMCKKYGNIGDSEIKTRFLIDRKNKVAMHMIAKCGMTTMKTVMLRIASLGNDGFFTKPQKIHTLANNAWEKYDMRKTSYSLADVRIHLSDYTVFMVARHPISRVISAYKDKMLASHNKRQNYIPGINECLHKIELSELVAEKPSLTGFLEAILSNCTISTNAHWISYFKTSKPCQIEYQYILKQETMQEDLSDFLRLAYKDIDYEQYLDIQFNSTPQKSNKTSSRFAVNIGEFLDINSTLVDRMKEHYKYEAIFFGYNFIKEKSIAECGLKTGGVTCC